MPVSSDGASWGDNRVAVASTTVPLELWSGIHTESPGRRGSKLCTL